MGEEVRMVDYNNEGGSNSNCNDDDDDDEDRVLEWEDGLPNATDLTPLSQHLIPPVLASAFSITSESCRSMLDVNRASQKTMSSLRRQNSLSPSSNNSNLKFFNSFNDPLIIVEGNEHDPGTPTKDGSESRKSTRRMDNIEEAEAEAEDYTNDDQSARSSKRARLVWTPQLHKRFVDVVAHLGIKNAVPKTIMQLMNVEGLTRENVASHLQKYRLYLKRMQGLSNEGPSSSDPLFASTPVPQSLHEPIISGNGHMPAPVPPTMMTYGAQVLPMPVHGHMGMPVGNPAGGGGAYPGFEYNYNPYGMFREQQRDWSCNQFGPMMSYPHAASEK